MTQDFAKPSTTRKPAGAKKAPGKKSRPKQGKTPPPPAPGKSRFKLIAFLVLLSATFIGALYYLQTVPPTAHVGDEKSTSKKQQTKPKTELAVPDQRFKFYDILPETEVVSPKVDAYQFKEKNQDTNIYYLVQTGSFKNPKDAEKQKAIIAFQGLKADIQVVRNQQGSTWHRVVAGPFYTRSEMNSALDKLVAINIEPLVKKVRKPE